jgi:hypothetical protein
MTSRPLAATLNTNRRSHGRLLVSVRVKSPPLPCCIINLPRKNPETGGELDTSPSQVPETSSNIPRHTAIRSVQNESRTTARLRNPFLIMDERPHRRPHSLQPKHITRHHRSKPLSRSNTRWSRPSCSDRENAPCVLGYPAYPIEDTC